MDSIWQSQVDIKIKLYFKIRLFKAAFISLLVYGSEIWIRTEKLIEKLDIVARICYLIILGIKQYTEWFYRCLLTLFLLPLKINFQPFRQTIAISEVVSLSEMTVSNCLVNVIRPSKNEGNIWRTKIWTRAYVFSSESSPGFTRDTTPRFDIRFVSHFSTPFQISYVYLMI